MESLELTRPVLQQGRKELIERWLQEDKLGCSEELGDLVRQMDTRLALQVYYKAEVKHKVIACFAETGQFDKIVAYAQKVDYSPDWSYLLKNILQMNKQGALQLATLLVTNPDGDLSDIVPYFCRGFINIWSKNVIIMTTVGFGCDHKDIIDRPSL